MVAAIQTFGELLHWHPHFHVLLTCGAFTPQGEFLELPELDLERLQAAWQEAVFALYLAEEKIEPEVVENMRSWPHSGFSVDQSVYLPAGDRAGIERLVGYMTRCPFSLSRLVQVTETGQVVYKPEKDACRAFPDPQRDELARGPKRNFQILDPLEFLAEFTQHIPPRGANLIRGHRPKVGRGWYSNKTRGQGRKAAVAPTGGQSVIVRSPHSRAAGRRRLHQPLSRSCRLYFQAETRNIETSSRRWARPTWHRSGHEIHWVTRVRSVLESAERRVSARAGHCGSSILRREVGNAVGPDAAAIVLFADQRCDLLWAFDAKRAR